jgi:hypothetical protein
VRRFRTQQGRRANLWWASANASLRNSALQPMIFVRPRSLCRTTVSRKELDVLQQFVTYARLGILAGVMRLWHETRPDFISRQNVKLSDFSQERPPGQANFTKFRAIKRRSRFFGILAVSPAFAHLKTEGNLTWTIINPKSLLHYPVGHRRKLEQQFQK